MGAGSELVVAPHVTSVARHHRTTPSQRVQVDTVACGCLGGENRTHARRTYRFSALRRDPKSALLWALFTLAAILVCELRWRELRVDSPTQVEPSWPLGDLGPLERLMSILM